MWGLCVGSWPEAENPSFLLRGGFFRDAASLPYEGNVDIWPFSPSRPPKTS